jgi:hypothetical protein
MPLSFHDATVPVFVRMLGNLAEILRKAEAHGGDPAALLKAKLADDMFDFTRQVQIACDTAKMAASRLAGIEAPKYPDTETSFAELQTRISNTIGFLASVSPDAVNEGENRTVTMTARGTTLSFTGQQYLLGFALPNFFFHAATAYGILRNQGVPLGKFDYLGKPQA